MFKNEEDAMTYRAPVYRRSVEELAKLIEGKWGKLTKMSGKPNATLPVGTNIRGRFSLYLGFVRCEKPSGEFIATTMVKSWRVEDRALLVRTQNSEWKIELEDEDEVRHARLLEARP